MSTALVVTLVGEDRPGIVAEISALVLAAGANWEESRMARLSGKFAGILRITVPPAHAEELASALMALRARGLTVVVEASSAAASPRMRTVQLELVGHDRPGIVREITKVLTQIGVNIEEFETALTSAPDSGDALFRSRARLGVPIALTPAALRGALEAVAMDLMVDVVLDA